MLIILRSSLLLSDQLFGELVQHFPDARYYHTDGLFSEVRFILVEFRVRLLTGQLGELHDLANAIYYDLQRESELVQATELPVYFHDRC